MLISLALSQLWRQNGPAELSSRWGRCYWNKMAERAGGAAEESWGNAEERVKGGEEFTPVSAVLPKEQHPRREGGDTLQCRRRLPSFVSFRTTFWQFVSADFKWRYCICCNQEPSGRTGRINHEDLSRGQPGTLTPLPEMSLLCVGGKGGTLSECD